MNNGSLEIRYSSYLVILACSPDVSMAEGSGSSIRIRFDPTAVLPERRDILLSVRENLVIREHFKHSFPEQILESSSDNVMIQVLPKSSGFK